MAFLAPQPNKHVVLQAQLACPDPQALPEQDPSFTWSAKFQLAPYREYQSTGGV